MENEKRVDRVWFDPVCLLHKRISTRFLSLSSFFLFLALLRRLVLWETLTLNSSFQPRISQNMVQSLLFIVLNTDLALKFTNPSWGDVNLGFACGFWTVLVLAFFDSNLFLNASVYWFVGLQRLIHVVNLGIFESFLEIFRVSSISNQNSLNPHWFTLFWDSRLFLNV